MNGSHGLKLNSPFFWSARPPATDMCGCCWSLTAGIELEKGPSPHATSARYGGLFYAQNRKGKSFQVRRHIALFSRDLVNGCLRYLEPVAVDAGSLTRRAFPCSTASSVIWSRAERRRAARRGLYPGKSAVRLVRYERLELPPRPTKDIEIDRTVDSGTCAGVVKLPDHPLAPSERGRPKQAPQPEPLAC